MRSWWNSLVSNNRHANSKKNPYNPSFTSIRTAPGHDSVASLTKHTAYSAYDVSSPSSSQVNLTSPYQTQFPGLLRRDTGNNQGLAMQDFNEGVAPPPPVADSWRRIDQWAEDNYPELFDQLSYGATEADIDELEHSLELHLPGDVRESFFIHDGQERGGRPSGLFFGVALLDCEELVDEYDLWKKVAASLPRPNEYPQHSPALGSSSPNLAGLRKPKNNGQQSEAPSRRGRPTQIKQGSRPEGAIQAVYAHPGWVPLAKDYMGNNIAIDLAPGPRGRVGQVILYGRECDVKYVVAPSWASFLATFVNDLESDHVVVDEDVGVGGEMGQLRYLVDTEKPEQQYSYFETLKARVRRRDRAVRGAQGDLASSTSLDNQSGAPRRNGKARASSPLKHDNLPKSSLGMQSNISRDMLTGDATNGTLTINSKEKAVGKSADVNPSRLSEQTIIETMPPTAVAEDTTPITVTPASPIESKLEVVSLDNPSEEGQNDAVTKGLQESPIETSVG